MIGVGRFASAAQCAARSADAGAAPVRRREVTPGPAPWCPKTHCGTAHEEDCAAAVQGTLYPHQRASLRALQEIESRGGLCVTAELLLAFNWAVLADPCGAGKTRTVCALLYDELQRGRQDGFAALKAPYKPVVASRATGSEGAAALFSDAPHDVLPITVVVTSLSVQGQWADELKRWGIQHQIVTRRPSRVDSAPPFELYLQQDVVRRGGLVVLMPVTLAQHWLPRLETARVNNVPGVHRVVYDEPDSARITSCPSFHRCRHVLMVSATFRTFSGYYGHVHRSARARTDALERTMVNFGPLWPNILDAICVQHAPEEVQSAMELPPVTTHAVSFHRPRVMQAVESVLPPHLSAMARADATNDLIRALGGVVYGGEQSVVEAVTSNLRNALQTAEQRLQHAAAYMPGTQSEMNALMRVDELRAKLHTLQGRVRENLQQPCPVCLEVGAAEACLCPKCSSSFCRPCILQWLQSRDVCPMCRGNVHVDTLVHLSHYLADSYAGEQEAQDTSLTDSDSAVVDAATRATASSGGSDNDDGGDDGGDDGSAVPWHAVRYNSRQLALVGAATGLCRAESNARGGVPICGLVYSAAFSTMGDIQQYLTEAGFRVGKLHGISSTRRTTLHRLRSGEIDFLVVDANTDAAGLDLPFVRYILLPYFCSRGQHEQIVGRAQRLGRTEPLQVVHLEEVS